MTRAPKRFAVRAMRTAISPRLAMRTDENMPDKSYPKRVTKSMGAGAIVLNRSLLGGRKRHRRRRIGAVRSRRARGALRRSLRLRRGGRRRRGGSGRAVLRRLVRSRWRLVVHDTDRRDRLRRGELQVR